MNNFDFIIIGAGCSGLSLLYEMNKSNILKIKLVQFLIRENNLAKIKFGHIGMFLNIHFLIAYWTNGTR